MSSEKAEIIKAIANLSVATIVVILLGVFGWTQMEDHRLERRIVREDRADVREIIENIVQEDIARAERFQQNQNKFIGITSRQADALERQAKLLDDIKNMLVEIQEQ